MSDSPIDAFGDHAEASGSSLRPDLRVFLVGAAATTLLSFCFLPAPVAAASSILAALMIAGADVDARLFLLPDAITYGATLCGLAAAPLLTDQAPWTSLAFAALRAAGAALTLFSLREAHRRLRNQEGLGLGEGQLARRRTDAAAH